MEIKENEVYNCDCLELMREMEKQGIVADWCITDPPYGIGVDGQKGCICKNPKHNRKQFEKKAGIIIYLIKNILTVSLMCQKIK